MQSWQAAGAGDWLMGINPKTIRMFLTKLLPDGVFGVAKAPTKICAWAWVDVTLLQCLYQEVTTYKG